MNSRPKSPKYARNKNVVVIGGSGSGKTRFWLTPQLLQAHSSYVVVDPKGGTLSQVGYFLQRKKRYKVKVFNSIDFSKSMHYNPLAYVRNEADILKFVDTLISNTKGEGKESDPFWTKAETLLYSRKYRNFLGSSFALRRLSDRVCLEHDLSVIQNPKLHSQGQYLHYGQWLGGDRRPSQKEQLRAIIDAILTERPADLPAFLVVLEASGVQVIHGRGGVLSFQLPGFARPARWRSSTLGDGYGPEAVQAVIDGTAPVRTPSISSARPAPRRLNLIIDIQQRMAQGKGPGYERWAKIYNLKQMAAALQFLREYGLTDYDELAAKTDAAVDQEHALAGELRAVQEELTHTTALMGAVVQYAKTRPVFDSYKAAKYSKKYLAQHESELADYREAKATMNDLLDGAKLPKMDVLKQKRRELAERKKALTAQYRAAQKEMRELVTAKGNIDHLINLTGGHADKEQTR